MEASITLSITNRVCRTRCWAPLAAGDVDILLCSLRLPRCHQRSSRFEPYGERTLSSSSTPRLSSNAHPSASTRKQGSVPGRQFYSHLKVGLPARSSISLTKFRGRGRLTFREGSRASALASSTSFSNSSIGILAIVSNKSASSGSLHDKPLQLRHWIQC